MIYNCEACGSSNVQHIGNELICVECGHSSTLVDRRASLLEPDTPQEDAAIGVLYSKIHDVLNKEQTTFRVGFKAIIAMLRGALTAWRAIKDQEIDAQQISDEKKEEMRNEVIVAQHIQTQMLILNTLPLDNVKQIVKALQDSIEYTEKKNTDNKKEQQ
jgi:hypothetical protein